MYRLSWRIAPCEVLAGFVTRHDTSPSNFSHHPNSRIAQGAVHIAEKIEEIKAQFLAEKIPLAEDLNLDEKTQLFTVRPHGIVEPDLLKTNLVLVEEALHDAMGGNGLLSGCWEQRTLNRTLTDYRDDPQRIEMDCMRVRARIEGKLGEELPESDELVALTDTLLTTALDIRAQHPEVANARAKRAVREASPEDRQALISAIPILRGITDENLGRQLADDLGEIIESTATEIAPDTLLPIDPVIRTGNRTAKMWIIAKKVGKGGVYVAGGVVAMDQAIPILAKIWPILAKWLGF